MSWRSIFISNPAYLNLKQGSLQIAQAIETQSVIAKIPLEDISVILIENTGVTLSAKLLSACADKQILVITVGEDYHPNGIFLPYLPHSRALKIMRAQIKQSLVKKKQLWKTIITQKIVNQAAVLTSFGHNTVAQRLKILATAVRSGDAKNSEAVASQLYFRTLWGRDFSRSNTISIVNAALNYGYAVIRAAIARALCTYGFLPAFGIFHHNELNAFNLADDLIEPYRPFVDLHVVDQYTKVRENEAQLTTQNKAALVNLLHQDIRLTQHEGNGACTLLAGIEATVISLSQWVLSSKVKNVRLVMPCVTQVVTYKQTVHE